MAKRGDLTPKQRRFVTEYLSNGRNAAAAYRAAYDTKLTGKSLANRASEMTTQAGIASVIAAADAKAAAALDRAVARYAITKERISDELAKLAFVDSRRVYRWDEKGVTVLNSDELPDDVAAAVVSVSHTVTKDGGTIRVQLADKRAALMDLARLHGHIIEKRDLRVIRSLGDLTDDELASLRAEAEHRQGTRH